MFSVTNASSTSSATPPQPTAVPHNIPPARPAEILQLQTLPPPPQQQQTQPSPLARPIQHFLYNQPGTTCRPNYIPRNLQQQQQSFPNYTSRGTGVGLPVPTTVRNSNNQNYDYRRMPQQQQQQQQQLATIWLTAQQKDAYMRGNAYSQQLQSYYAGSNASVSGGGSGGSGGGGGIVMVGPQQPPTYEMTVKSNQQQHNNRV